MKILRIIPLILIAISSAHAQGPLAAPGEPGPEMKSLQEIWDKIGGLETQVSQTQAEIAKVRADNQALSSLLAATNVSLPWLITTVDNAGDVGANPSLAFDSEGKACIAYYDISNGDLKFAVLETSGWQVSAVDTEGNVGHAPSLAFGHDGRPSIAYTDVTNSRIKYTRHDGNAWQPILVAEPGANLPSLAFGPDGNPAIAYRLGTAARLARFHTSWTTEAVSVETVASKAVLAFDLRNGMPVVAYQTTDGFPGGHRLVTASFNGVWNNQAGVASNSGFTPSIKAGPSGPPSVAYFQVYSSMDYQRAETFYRLIPASRLE